MNKLPWPVRAFVLISLAGVMFSSTVSGAPAPEKFPWLGGARIFLLDSLSYPFYPRMEFDAGRLAETMTDMRFNTLRLGATSAAYAIIPGTDFPPNPELGGRDILAECLAALKPRGIRVVAYVASGNALPTGVLEKGRRSWARWSTPSGELSRFHQVGMSLSPVCWNTPYRPAFLKLVRKVVSEYDIDGIYFDSWLMMYFYDEPRVCYCPGCREGFKKATGFDIPYRTGHAGYTDEDRAVFARFALWRNEVMVDVFNETKRLVKSIKDIPLIFNINHASHVSEVEPGNIFVDRRIIEGSDAFLYERGRSLLERAEGVSLGVSAGLSVWPYVGGFDGWLRIVHTGKEIAQEAFTTVAFGGSPIIPQCYYFVNDPGAEGRRHVTEAFRTLDENEKYVEGFTPVPYCAVVWNATDPPGHAIRDAHWQTTARDCSLGAFAACLYGHLQATSLLADKLDDLEALRRYKVLYLPDICRLSDRQAGTIAKFVEDGGGLVLTYGASRFRPDLTERPDFALAALAGIRAVHPNAALEEKISSNLHLGGTWDLYLKARPGQTVLRGALAGGLQPAFVYQPVEARPGAEVVADLVSGSRAEPLFPGIVVSRRGKGRVAYISPALDSAYLQTHNPAFSGIIRSVIAHVASEPPPFELEAPDSLLANMTARGKTSVLHLVNWSGAKLERVQQYVDELAPVETVRVRLPEGKKVRSVRLFVPGPHSQEAEGRSVVVTLPRIGDYQAVVFEWE